MTSESFICSDCKVCLNRDDKSTVQIPTPTCGCGKPMSRIRVTLSTPEMVGVIPPPVELPVVPKDDTRIGDVGSPGDPRCKRCGNRALEEAIHGRVRCWKCGLVQVMPTEVKP